jgi:hypothetical protein
VGHQGQSLNAGARDPGRQVRNTANATTTTVVQRRAAAADARKRRLTPLPCVPMGCGRPVAHLQHARGAPRDSAVKRLRRPDRTETARFHQRFDFNDACACRGSRSSSRIVEDPC